jgi:mannose-1-phosphate guanylyltransferase/mannose-6-phosphate isomerase
MTTIHPVILSGGAGTRLWPLSRAMFPKQFIRFFSRQADSYLAQALKRLPASGGFAAPLVVCNTDHRFLVGDELARHAIVPAAVILEPVARNTAAAIAVAALFASRSDPAAVIAVMPSDHVISDAALFAEAVTRAGRIAETGKLVLFGVVPTSAHTGYGYIRRGAPLGGSTGGETVAAFVEKPDKSRAEDYLASKEYLWNSGIFVLHARTFLDELARLEPSILEAARAALDASADDLGFLRLDAKAFATAPSISVDYAVMERTASAAVLPIDVGWNDVGSWNSLWETATKDEAGNAVEGDAVLDDVQNCFIHRENGLVAALGVENLVIIDTPDALLVADRSRSQDVGKLVQKLKSAGRKEQAQHVRNNRPWGYFETLAISARFQVKKLHVRPGGKLSMQMHHHRSEHWVVVQGTALVTVGDTEQLVRENESVYITATQWHRLENPGKVPLELIEVQIGTYLGEDDILRSDDIYRRAPEETR